MKRTILVICVIAMAFCLTACGCEHEWQEATCTTPKTCKLCEATEGDVKAHQWQDATCTAPKTCKDCGATEGEVKAHQWQDATCLVAKTCKDCGTTEGDLADHSWEEATCTEAKTCKVCEETEGEALGHTWADATCTEAKTCTVCSEKEGEALGHTSNSWVVEKEATCTEVGSESSVCSVCNESVTREIPMLEHTPGEWEVTVKATKTSDGTEVQNCSACGKELESRSYEFAPFDITPLKNKGTFKYDEFNKSWKYYQTYNKHYSNADESITIILFSEDNGTNIEDIELRAGVYWKDPAQANWKVDTVEFIVGDKLYSCEMKTPEGEATSYTFLVTDTSYQMIKDLAECTSVKAKISYTNGSSTELNVGSALRGICQDIVKYKMWDYYFPESWLAVADTTTVR